MYSLVSFFSAAATFSVKYIKFEIYIILCRYHTWFSFGVLNVEIDIFIDNFLSSSYGR